MQKNEHNPAVEALAKEMMLASNPVLNGQHGVGLAGAATAGSPQIAEKVRAFVQEHPELVNHPVSDGRTLLDVAINPTWMDAAQRNVFGSELADAGLSQSGLTEAASILREAGGMTMEEHFRQQLNQAAPVAAMQAAPQTPAAQLQSLPTQEQAQVEHFRQQLNEAAPVAAMQAAPQTLAAQQQSHVERLQAQAAMASAKGGPGI